MKKFISLTLTLCLVLSMCVFAQAATPTAKDVVVSNQTIIVNGNVVEMDVYNIDDSNYFKLRDIAFLLSGTASQFSVSYDDAEKAITATSGEAYTAVGGEMTVGKDNSASCIPSKQKALFNGKESTAYVYNIGGNNYFKLRDLGAEFEFIVDYDDASRSVIINSTDYDDSKEYFSVYCNYIAEAPEYIGYVYTLDNSLYDSMEIIDAKIHGKSVTFQNVPQYEIVQIAEYLGQKVHGGGYYYGIAPGTYTIQLKAIGYLPDGNEAGEITITHELIKEL